MGDVYMSITPEILASLLAALFGGGALARLFEVFFKRKKYKVQISKDERENLRHDVVSLRKEINELRNEVDDLRDELEERQQELASWTAKFFGLKLAVEKIIMYLRTKEVAVGDERLESLIQEAYVLMNDETDYE